MGPDGAGRVRRAARLGAIVAAATFAADQTLKLYLLFVVDLIANQPIRLAPFAELIVVWNRGISYGLFQQTSEFGRWALIVLSVLAAIGLSVWLARVTTTVLAVSIGLIIGGALGNVVDRLAYGAVFDFLHLSAGRFSWYVFNIADAAIVFGVIGLLYDSFVLERRRVEA